MSNNGNGNGLISAFSLPLLNWFAKFGRKDLPWQQQPKEAYRVWISEIMLQQTQVQTVIPFFERFIASFPDIKHVSDASEDTVLAHWSGLGYYSRARNIHKTARIICDKYQGQFPEDLAVLISLPGIGASTAAAIASLAFNQPTAILDGNVKRVLSRYFMVEGLPESSTVKKKLWLLAEQCMPQKNAAEYTQAIMDLGATCCTLKNPNCQNCPVQKTCQAFLNDKVDHYPFKTIKKTRPTKQQQFLLMHTSNHDRIYLEKRPSKGLWGGLWCLPAIELDMDPKQYIANNYGFNCAAINNLIKIKHSFSHFHLHITALALTIQPNAKLFVENTGEWFHVYQLDNIGLAKPVQQIINYFIEKSIRDKAYCDPC